VRRLRTFLGLTHAQRRAFFEAWRWLCASRMCLFASGLSPTLRAWQRPASTDAAWPPAARWIRIASRYLPGGGNCLVRSVALYGLLRRAGVAAELRIGVAGTTPALDAHAWVEIDGAPIDDFADVGARYQPFAASLPGHAAGP
jgi:Transglutaminase-like superfamily